MNFTIHRIKFNMSVAIFIREYGRKRDAVLTFFPKFSPIRMLRATESRALQTRRTHRVL